MVDDLGLAARRVDAGATHPDALGQGALTLADGLEVARVRRGRAAPELRRHAGLGNVADDRHAVLFLLVRELARRLLAVRRGRVDVQGHTLLRACSATASSRCSGISSRSCATPLRCRELSRIISMNVAVARPDASRGCCPAPAARNGHRARACESARRASPSRFAKPIREADLSFVVEILQDSMSIKPCSDRVRPSG